MGTFCSISQMNTWPLKQHEPDWCLWDSCRPTTPAWMKLRAKGQEKENSESSWTCSIYLTKLTTNRNRDSDHKNELHGKHLQMCRLLSTYACFFFWLSSCFLFCVLFNDTACLFDRPPTMKTTSVLLVSIYLLFFSTVSNNTIESMICTVHTVTVHYAIGWDSK